MAKRKEIGNKPAGKNDELNLTYTQFAADEKRKEIRIGEGFEFENDLLLKSFGFELDNSGTLTMKALDNEKIHIEEETNKIERIIDGKVVSDAKVSKAKIERMIEREKLKEKDDKAQDDNNIIDTPAIESAVKNVRRKARAGKSNDDGR